jgi:hypothetical protein
MENELNNKNKQIYVIFDDYDNEESVKYYDIPVDEPDTSKFLGTSYTYKMIEQQARKFKNCLIYKYEINEQQKLTKGCFIKKITS